MFVDLTVIYVADSESSSIRALDLKTGGSTLLAGGDPVFSDNLFKVIYSELSNHLQISEKRRSSQYHSNHILPFLIVYSVYTMTTNCKF